MHLQQETPEKLKLGIEIFLRTDTNTARISGLRLLLNSSDETREKVISNYETPLRQYLLSVLFEKDDAFKNLVEDAHRFASAGQELPLIVSQINVESLLKIPMRDRP